MRRHSFQSATLAALLVVLVACQPQEATNESTEEKTELVLEMDYERSLVTWILQGDSLRDGAARIDTGALLVTENELLSGASWTSRKMLFVTDTVQHTLQLDLSNLTLYDSSLLAVDSVGRDFVLEGPTHVASATISIKDITKDMTLPIRVLRGKKGIELEGKLSVYQEGIIGRGNWHTLHVGFLIHSDIED